MNNLQISEYLQGNILKYFINAYIDKIDVNKFWQMIEYKNEYNDIILFRKKLVNICNLAKSQDEADIFLRIWDKIISWQKANLLYTESIELYDEELKLLHNFNRFNSELLNLKENKELIHLIEQCLSILIERISKPFD